MIGEPDAGKPPVRFDEGVQETCGIVTRLCPTLRTLPPWGKFFGTLTAKPRPRVRGKLPAERSSEGQETCDSIRSRGDDN